MRQIKRSDIPLLDSIRKHQRLMELQFDYDLSESHCDPCQIGYAIMLQLDTLNQIKALVCSICNDRHDDP